MKVSTDFNYSRAVTDFIKSNYSRYGKLTTKQWVSIMNKEKYRGKTNWNYYHVHGARKYCESKNDSIDEFLTLDNRRIKSRIEDFISITNEKELSLVEKGKVNALAILIMEILEEETDNRIKLASLNDVKYELTRFA